MGQLDVSLHPAQQDVYDCPERFRTLVCGRRFGKSRLAIWEVILRTLEFSGPVSKESPETTLVVMPTLTQAKPVLWKPLLALAESQPLASYRPRINRSDLTIQFPGKPVIQVVGANDRQGDGLRGKRLWFLLVDEYQDLVPGVFDAVLRPALADTPGSRALFTGTPKGKLNPLYTAYSQEHPDYRGFNLPTAANPFVPREEIRNAELTLPPRLFRQEFLATWEDFPGTIYWELDESNLVSWSPEFDRTFIGYDFGDVNPAIVVLGLKEARWFFLEGWQPTGGVPVPQYLQDQELVRLATKYQVSGTFCDPSRPSAIMGIRTLGWHHSLPGLQAAVAGYNRIEEGLTQVHSLIYQRKLLFLDGKVDRSRGLVTPRHAYDLLRSYHRKSLGELVYPQVAEGQDDHVPDAVRMVLARATG